MKKIEIKLLKSSTKPNQKKTLQAFVTLYWNYLIFVGAMLFIGIVFFSFYIFYRINNDSFISKNPAPAVIYKDIDRENLRRAFMYAQEKRGFNIDWSSTTTSDSDAHSIDPE